MRLFCLASFPPAHQGNVIFHCGFIFFNYYAPCMRLEATIFTVWAPGGARCYVLIHRPHPLRTAFVGRLARQGCPNSKTLSNEAPDGFSVARHIPECIAAQLFFFWRRGTEGAATVNDVAAPLLLAVSCNSSQFRLLRSTKNTYFADHVGRSSAGCST